MSSIGFCIAHSATSFFKEKQMCMSFCLYSPFYLISFLIIIQVNIILPECLFKKGELWAQIRTTRSWPAEKSPSLAVYEAAFFKQEHKSATTQFFIYPFVVFNGQLWRSLLNFYGEGHADLLIYACIKRDVWSF